MKKGITLIVLVITIVVLLILTGVVIGNLTGFNSVLTDANKAAIMQTYSGFKELAVTKAIERQGEIILSREKETDLMYNIYTGDSIKDVIPNLPDDLINKIAVVGKHIVYIADEITEETKILEELGYIIIEEDDLDYVIELQMIENVTILTNIYNYNKIGGQLSTDENPEAIYIAGIAYEYGWSILGENNNIINELNSLNKFDITPEIESYFSHGPYLVDYKKGYVISIEGKVINETIGDKLLKHTFNYNGQSQGLVTDELLTGVFPDSVKNDTYWGEFTSNPTSSLLNKEYNYVTDKYGNIGLKLDDTITSVSLNQNIRIDEEFSISVLISDSADEQGNTFAARDYYADGIDKVGGTIAAISDRMDYYIGWLSIVTDPVKGDKLRIHVYNWVEDIEENGKLGFYSLDISEYNQNYMHIQLTSRRSGETVVYINGIEKARFESGSYDLTYNELHVGALRPGTGFFNYNGVIHSIGIYGDILKPDEITSNWEYIKKIYHLDDNGIQN